MPLIHHPVLRREMEVSEAGAELLTTAPRVPWKLGPLPKPTAISANPSPLGDTNPPNEED